MQGTEHKVGENLLQKWRKTAPEILWNHQEREQENGTSRDKGGIDFFMKGIYMYSYWEGNAKKKKKKRSRESLSLGQAEVLWNKILVTVVREKGK